MNNRSEAAEFLDLAERVGVLRREVYPNWHNDPRAGNPTPESIALWQSVLRVFHWSVEVGIVDREKLWALVAKHEAGRHGRKARKPKNEASKVHGCAGDCHQATAKSADDKPKDRRNNRAK